MKKCKDCFIERLPSDFYKGQGECKICTRFRVKKRQDNLKLSSDWVEKERARGREKYYRLNYKEAQKNKEKSYVLMATRNYRKRYPEKNRATSLSQRIKREKGTHNHHWDYDSPMDVINLTIKDHAKAHRFLKYDKFTHKYKTIDGVLLNSKESHLEYITAVINLPF